MLQGALVKKVNASCVDCPAGIDLDQAEFSIKVFAETMAANCEQTSRIITNTTGLLPGKVASYADLWRFTLINYNAGAGCLTTAIKRTYLANEPLTWKNVSSRLEVACAGALDYVNDISLVNSGLKPTPTTWVVFGTPQVPTGALGTLVNHISTEPYSGTESHTWPQPYPRRQSHSYPRSANRHAERLPIPGAAADHHPGSTPNLVSLNSGTRRPFTTTSLPGGADALFIINSPGMFRLPAALGREFNCSIPVRIARRPYWRVMTWKPPATDCVERNSQPGRAACSAGTNCCRCNQRRTS